MKTDIKPGSVVKLRSDGPLMTVEHVRVVDDFDNNIPVADVCWFDDEQELHRKTIPLWALVKDQ
jgi:hypothetical protein